MSNDTNPAGAVEAAYIVSILGDLGAGDGYEPLPPVQVMGRSEDEAIAGAFDEARAKWPNVGDMNLSWAKPAAGQIVAGGDLRFSGGPYMQNTSIYRPHIPSL